MRHSGLSSVTSLVKMPSASRTRAGKPHWVIYRFTMPRRANKRWKIRRGLEPVSCLKCVHPLFHEEEENCTTTFSDNPTENPPKIQSLPTHPRADVKVGVKFWSPQSVSGALQQKGVAAQLKTMGTTKKWHHRVCYIRCNPSLWKPRERIQPNWFEKMLFTTRSMQLSSCTQSEVGARQHF